MNQHPLDRDLETARTIHNWLERTAEELPDSPTGRERLLEDVERASQRSGRWLPPVYPAGMDALFAAARLAAALGVVILAIGALLMVVLPRESAVVLDPGSETASPSTLPTEPPLSASVSGTITGGRSLGDEVSHWEGDVYYRTEPEVVREVAWSDPRLPPEMRHWISWQEYVLDPESPSQRGGVKSGRVRLADEHGAWVGVIDGVFPYDDRWETEWFTLTGSGAYEGLFAVLVATHWYDTDTFEFEHQIEGLIAEGEPPQARPLPPAERTASLQGEETTAAGSAHVTGTLRDMSHDQAGQAGDRRGNVSEWRDRVTTFQYDWSDPRMPAEIRAFGNANEYVLQGGAASERGGYARGTAVGRGPAGSWEGSFTDLHADDPSDVRSWMVLTGSGGYEGLYAVIIARQWYDADAVEYRHEVEALIAEGVPPPLPEAPAS